MHDEQAQMCSIISDVTRFCQTNDGEMQRVSQAGDPRERPECRSNHFLCKTTTAPFSLSHRCNSHETTTETERKSGDFPFDRENEGEGCSTLKCPLLHTQAGQTASAQSVWLNIDTRQLSHADGSRGPFAVRTDSNSFLRHT